MHLLTWPLSGISPCRPFAYFSQCPPPWPFPELSLLPPCLVSFPGSSSPALHFSTGALRGFGSGHTSSLGESDNSHCFGDHLSLLSPKWMGLSTLASLLSFRPKYLEASRNFNLDQHASTEFMIFSSQTWSFYKPDFPVSVESYKPRVENHLKLVCGHSVPHQIGHQVLYILCFFSLNPIILSSSSLLFTYLLEIVQLFDFVSTLCWQKSFSRGLSSLRTAGLQQDAAHISGVLHLWSVSPSSTLPFNLWPKQPKLLGAPGPWTLLVLSQGPRTSVYGNNPRLTQELPRLPCLNFH